jgi:hypothetical protein
MNRYPLARYHCITGQFRLILSDQEEAALGPEWGEGQADVRYPPNPVPEVETVTIPPVFSIEIPEVK